MTKALTGGQMTAADEEALAYVMACRHPYAVKEGGIGIQDPEEARICRCFFLILGVHPCTEGRTGAVC